ncbi:MAG TPA: S8 family serine peptidase, partial [Candidatus Sulfomarinibacteraceae bacterium]|nr:S8 family serine peptidase [Candidatus Sulfomarinibacteraceae bacterium]
MLEPDARRFDARKARVSVVRDIDYGSFRWLVLEPHELDRLEASGIECRPEEAASEIHIAGRRFDPLLHPVENAESASLKAAAEPGWWIVQFAGPVTDDWLWWLRRAGMDPVQYLPVNAYLVWRDGAAVPDRARIASAPFLRWTGPLTSDLKRRPSAKPSKDGTGRFEALVYGARGVEPTVRRMEAAGCRVTGSFKAQPDGRLWTVLFEAAAEPVDAAARLPGTLWIGRAPDRPELAGEMSSVVNAGAFESGGPFPGYRDTLDELGADGSGVIWAVVDSGLDPEHPDLDIVAGLNGPGCETPVPGDDLSFMKHGTAVAGILSGTAATGRADDDGFLYGLGVAPGARLVAHNGICGLGPWPPDEGWESLTRAVLTAGAAGMNASWFSGTADQQGYDSSARAMDILVRDGNFATAGVAEPCPMVFAAGNSGPDAMTLRPPNHAKNIISVGAIRNWRSAGDADTVTDFSSRGPTIDGRIAPVLVAPAEAVTTTAHRDGGAIGDIGAIDGTDGLYTMFEGTSAAAPHVSGSLAVITEWWRRSHRDQDPSPAMAKALLVNGAVDLDDVEPVPNMDEGWGRVDLGQVLDPGTPMMLIDQTVLLRESGESWRIDVEIADPSQPLKVTLAWTDAAALPEAEPALVNDLDLGVETAGRAYLGN